MSTYDRIAPFYDLDMGRNMAHDDVAFYVRECRAATGRILELGCGNGRILLELVAQGLDAYGIEASAPMIEALRAKAQARGLDMPPVCRADMRSLPFARAMRVVLCPYSLVTYLVTDDDVARMLATVGDALEPGGSLVVDAFVPRAVESSAVFTLDYRRDHEGGVLQRWKRITALPAGINRIERRYERIGHDGALLERIDAVEEIRPFTPEALSAALRANGYRIAQTWWDYGASGLEGAQFFTARAVRT